jgi:peptidylprolyl isomerase
VRRRYVALSLVALTLPLLAACADEDPADTGAPATPTSETANCAAFEGVPAIPGIWGQRPTIPKPEGKAPTELKTEDCLVGDGAPVTDTSVPYSWNYEGAAWSTGEVFDSSFERGQPIPFALNQVIAGWTEGLQGMKPGGRRLLVIPSAQAYGESPPPGSGIKPGEDLVFVVDLVGPAEDTSNGS